MAKKDRPMTQEEGLALQEKRDAARTKLVKAFCTEVANLPDEFVFGSGMTVEAMKEHLEPVANRLYQLMKDEGMVIEDARYVEVHLHNLYGYTLERIMNFCEALIVNLTEKHFGVKSLVSDLPVAQLELHGLRVVPMDETGEEQ